MFWASPLATRPLLCSSAQGAHTHKKEPSMVGQDTERDACLSNPLALRVPPYPPKSGEPVDGCRCHCAAPYIETEIDAPSTRTASRAALLWPRSGWIWASSDKCGRNRATSSKSSPTWSPHSAEIGHAFGEFGEFRSKPNLADFELVKAEFEPILAHFWSMLADFGRFGSNLVGFWPNLVDSEQVLVDAWQILVDLGRCRVKRDGFRGEFGRFRDNFGRFRGNFGRFRGNVGRFRVKIGRNSPNLAQLRSTSSKLVALRNGLTLSAVRVACGVARTQLWPKLQRIGRGRPRISRIRTKLGRSQSWSKSPQN